MVTPCLVTGDDAIQETVTFSLVLVQQVLKNLHTVFFMFLCEHTWDPPGANFAIFQHCHHRFQRNEADIRLCTQFPSHNPPIRMEELIEMLFISWCDSCAWPSETWLVFHAPATTAETRHPPLHCGNIHGLFSINVQQALINVIEWNFFCMEEFNYTHLLHTHFHVRCHFVRQPLCCHLSHGNKI